MASYARSRDLRSSASSSDDREKNHASPVARKRRRPLRWLAAIALLAAFVWFLPPIVAHTPLLPWIVNTAAADLDGTVAIRSASLDWLSPVVVQGIEVNGKDGKNIVALRSLTSERSLASLAWNYTDLGMFHLQSPRVSVVLHPEGSNVEDALAKYLTESKASTKKTPSTVAFSFGADIADAAVTVAEPATGQMWQVERVAVRFEMPKNAPASLKVRPADVSGAGSLVETAKTKKKCPAWRLAGRLGCEVQWQTSGDAIQAEASVELSGLTVTEAEGGRFQEPVIRLAAAGIYDSKSQSFNLTKMTLSSSIVAVGAAGRVAPQGGRNEAQVNCQLRYDLQRLTGLLRPYLGPSLSFYGQGETMVSYHGPFSAADARAEASFQWTRADVGGATFGPGKIKAAMANGVIQAAPVQLAAGQGRWRVAPWVRFAKGPTEFGLAAGPLAERVPLNPSLCASMLKYAVPALADAKIARGSFSIDLTECRIPLKNPSQSVVSGRLVLHSVELGSSPMLREFANVAGRESLVRLRENSVIAFRMANGRIYHEGLELQFPELVVRLNGSVGLDQTMATTVEMPIPSRWLTGAASEALRNQKIQVPLKGTLSRPALDQAALERASRQLVQKAAGSVIGNEVNRQVDRQVDRLFGPKR